MAKIWLVLILPFFLTGCIWENEEKVEEKKVIQEENLKGNSQLGNPASINCQNIGGEVVIENDLNGGQGGVCVFNDGKECEEWALFRGDCPKNGVDTKGLTKEQRNCLIKGGIILANGNVETCSLKNGSKCPMKEYFEGTCPKFID